MLVDYHIHTPYCGHAHGKTLQYIERAIELGLTEIGFADHLGRYYLTHVQRRRYWDWGMHERHIGRYFDELSELKELYADRITIKTGLEIDFIEGAEELLHPLIDRYDFDFFLGSIHCLPRFGWRHLSEYSSAVRNEKLFAEYFRVARSAMQSSLFHSIAHLDFVWRYIQWPENNSRDFFEREISATTQTALDTGTCIEINANGYIWSETNIREGEIDPFIILLSTIRKKGIPITIGSDAHNPQMVAKSFSDLVTVLRSWGITICTTFTHGKPVIVPLSMPSQ